MLWLALHLPALSLESWAATRSPEQAGRPLALLHEHQVQHADALALERGVRIGMKRATALALAPDLLLAAADALRDTQALRAVAHVALAFSPSVTWATPAGLAARPRSSGAAPVSPRRRAASKRAAISSSPMSSSASMSPAQTGRIAPSGPTISSGTPGISR